MATVQEIFDNLISQLSSMTFADFFDILLVAFLLYKLLPLFRSAGTLRIAKAIVVVIVVAWLSNLLNLHAVHYLLNQVLTVGIIAIVVLFQPEIRRILDHVGSVSLRAYGYF